MTIFQGYDGELRLIEYGNSGTTYYIEVLFCEMDFSGPLKRPWQEETIIIDRGRMDEQARYIEGDDMVRYSPLTFGFNCRLADTVNSQVLSDWLSGVTKVSGATQLYSFKGKTTIDGNTLPSFDGSTSKYAYRLEVLWDGTNDYGLRYDEVCFKPAEQRITESPDGLVLSCNGQIYGDVSRISAFTSSITSIV